MNKHIFYDNLTVKTAEMAFRNFRFFADSLDSASLQQHIANTNLQLPEFNLAGTYEVPASTLVGEQDPAFHVAQWLGSEYPVLLYHHGNNERPFDFGMASKNTFKKILLSEKVPFPANLVALRAPYHQDLKIYMNAARKMDHFTAMLATSVCLMEALVKAFHEQFGSTIMVAGISLGGWVVNLHKAYFDSAEVYAPMLAGAALDDVFISSAYNKLAGQNVQNNPEQVQSVLNFESDYHHKKLNNVFPLLARYDQIIQYDRQKRCYPENQLTVLDRGHTTATLESKQLKSHLSQALGSVTLQQHSS